MTSAFDNDQDLLRALAFPSWFRAPSLLALHDGTVSSGNKIRNQGHGASQGQNYDRGYGANINDDTLYLHGGEDEEHSLSIDRRKPHNCEMLP